MDWGGVLLGFLIGQKNKYRWHMWLLVTDRPHYPEVEEYPTQDLAELALQDWVKENHREDGVNNSTAYVAYVSTKVTCKTYY